LIDNDAGYLSSVVGYAANLEVAEVDYRSLPRMWLSQDRLRRLRCLSPDEFPYSEWGDQGEEIGYRVSGGGTGCHPRLDNGHRRLAAQNRAPLQWI
jgi:hypothetical protein